MSCGALVNLHELAYDQGDFVYKITTYPDLVVVCGSKPLLSELDRIIKVNSDHPVLLSYDTTFKLGDFYVSPLLFKHVLFVEAPVMPATFLIHERMLPAAHKESLSKVKEPVPIVTDDEVGICQEIDKCLSGVHRLE